MDERLVIGCMTGTSLDGIDAAAVRIRGEGLGMSAEFVAGRSAEFGEERDGLARLAGGEAMAAGEIAAVCSAYGARLASVVGELAREIGTPAFVALHGQTVFHGGGRTWQLVDGWSVARALACPVVCDLRGADVSAGGEGAPIMPLADWVMFRDAARPRVIVNLGGFCSVTVLPAGCGVEGVGGFDVCACNLILDGAARMVFRRAMDEGGAIAETGRAHEEALGELAEEIERQTAGGRSLGSGDEARRWIEKWGRLLEGQDVLATAVVAVGGAIGRRIAGLGLEEVEVVCSGGGSRHGLLVRTIAEAAGCECVLSDVLGVPIGFREAMGMGILGALSADGAPITLPGVTGARDPIPLGGAWLNVRPKMENGGG